MVNTSSDETIELHISEFCLSELLRFTNECDPTKLLA